MAIHTIWRGPLFILHPTFTTYHGYLSLLWKMTGTSVHWAWITPTLLPLSISVSLFLSLCLTVSPFCSVTSVSPGLGRPAAIEMWFSGDSFHFDKAKRSITGKNVRARVCACKFEYTVSHPMIISDVFNQGCWLRVRSYLQQAYLGLGDSHANIYTHTWCVVFADSTVCIMLF